MRPVPRELVAGDAEVVAPQLLNRVLVVGGCAGRIVEVEAYRSHDPASHTFHGRTNRNSVMFGPPGHLYVYFTYGMHHCANVVTGAVGDGQGVLMRAVEPLSGVEEMIARRGRSTHLADGPGKLCQAFGLDLSSNGLDLCSGGTVGLFDDGTPPPDVPLVSPRIGLRVGVDTLWRWRVPPVL
jgi:DNA-3-methyladenine glycosylase